MLEALANSCCILALDTKFSREMLADGEYGMFFEFNQKDLIEKINYVDDNRQVVEEFKNKSKNRILEYYNWENVAKSYINLLSGLEN